MRHTAGCTGRRDWLRPPGSHRRAPARRRGPPPRRLRDRPGPAPGRRPPREPPPSPPSPLHVKFIGHRISCHLKLQGTTLGSVKGLKPGARQKSPRARQERACGGLRLRQSRPRGQRAAGVDGQCMDPVCRQQHPGAPVGRAAGCRRGVHRRHRHQACKYFEVLGLENKRLQALKRRPCPPSQPPQAPGLRILWGLWLSKHKGSKP